MLKKTIRENLKAVMVAAALLVLYVAVYFSIFFYNKSWSLNGSVDNFEPIAIKKGRYEISIDYSADDQVYLEGYIMTKDQEFVIDKFLLEPSETAYTAKLPMNIPYDINNPELSFRMSTVSGGNALINRVGLDYAGGKLNELVALVVFVALLTAIILLSGRNTDSFVFTLTGLSDTESEKIFDSLLVGISFLMLHESFAKNPVFMLIYSLLICIYILGIVKHSKNLQIFILFYMILMCVMCVYSPPSPLFTRELGPDASIYYSIAKGIANDKVLYRDVFDHKGPIIYFIYTFAYWVCKGGTNGVFLLDVLFMTTAVFFTYRIAERYMSEKAAYCSAFASFLVFFNSTYTYEGGECEWWFMGLFLIAIFYLISDNQSLRAYFIQGLIFSFVLYIKLNIVIGLLVIVVFCGLRLLFRKQYLQLIKSIGVYICAFFVMTVIPVVYLAINKAFDSFYEVYILFNLKYSQGYDSSIENVFIRLFQFYRDNKYIAILTMLGFAFFFISKRFTDIYGKLGLLSVFMVMIYISLSGHKAFDYYNCNIALYALLGIVGVMTYLSGPLGRYFESYRCCMFACVFFALVTVSVNNEILRTDLIDTEPKKQDVLAHEMRIKSKADASFIEWECLEMGLFPAADVAPEFRYFFWPNISQSKAPELFDEMRRYMKEGLPEYIVAERYSTDSYLEGEEVAKYELVSVYDAKDALSRVYMIYQRK